MMQVAGLNPNGLSAYAVPKWAFNINCLYFH